ncbi:MAG: tetratricopeptide repeat protein [Akkermansia sp.]|nr:tetratricopeptide repeat protein [Akkermansia sp.]
MRHALILLAGLAALLLPAAAQEPPIPRQQITTAELPQWLVEFSNLPRAEREAYLASFRQAKIAYQQNQWVLCIGHLADCEMIFRGNPNVWNLRACCHMEQKYFEEAAEELERARQAMPDDPVTTLNIANLQLARGQHEACITTLRQLREALPYDAPAELLYTLQFRELLCLVMLNRSPEARGLIKGISPVADTPLYYYSQAVFALAEGNRAEASRCLRVARTIFAKNAATQPYQRALQLSDIANFTPTPASDK